MKTLSILSCFAILCSHTMAESLSPADREALLEALEKLKEDAESKVDARFRLAVAAYRAASGSEEAALEFYLKCVEKVNFEDRERKASDFREWKRKEAERLSSADFRKSLRAQLLWLMIYLRSASENADRPALAAEAQAIVDAVFEDAKRLEAQFETLSQPVLGTVFARAYEVGGLEEVKWPQSPMQLEEFYDKVVFPQYRRLSTLDSLRTAWIKRIRQEEVKVTADVQEVDKKPGQTRKGSSLNADKFTTEILPELRWQMEMDLFKAGDESGAASRMLQHITSNLGHRSARKWSDEFRDLLSGNSGEAAGTGTTDPQTTPGEAKPDT